MNAIFEREIALLGAENVRKLNNSRVIVFGVGGVGSYAVEALARSGVGSIALVDSDKVEESNINRQLIALRSTLNRSKVEVSAERIRDINPDAEVRTYEVYACEENMADFRLGSYDYVLDCIDSVASKLCLIRSAKQAGVRIISAMGAGNKLNPTMFEVADISKTSVCPLAKAVRTGLRKIGITSLKVVYSREQPASVVKGENGRIIKGSIAFCPSVAGLIMAAEVIKDLTEGERDENR